MDLHIREVSFKSVSNGYLLQYGQQTNAITTQEVAVFNTLGQVSAHVDKLDELHAQKVKDFNKQIEAAKAVDGNKVETIDG